MRIDRALQPPDICPHAIGRRDVDVFQEQQCSDHLRAGDGDDGTSMCGTSMCFGVGHGTKPKMSYTVGTKPVIPAQTKTPSTANMTSSSTGQPMPRAM